MLRLSLSIRIRTSLEISVRISKYRGKLKRGYSPNYTSEVFVVTDVLKTTPVTYRIAEIRNADRIIGTFYPEELSLWKPTSVEQIINL